MEDQLYKNVDINSYSLVAFDYILDSDLRPWLLEVEKNLLY